MHITASVFINDDESGLHNDFDRGLWEQIFYYEIDGGRDKEVLIKIIGECVHPLYSSLYRIQEMICVTYFDEVPD